MKKLILILTLAGIALMQCSKVPITGRKQLKVLPKATMNSMSFTQYRQFLNEHPVSSNATQAAMVANVGRKIQQATEKYFAKTGKSKYLNGYSWEFKLVDEDIMNAWCMPGGKVVVYSGILPVTQNESGLAVVMGHEIAHAIANHGNERMSQGLATQLGGIGLAVALREKSSQVQQIFMGAFGVGTALGVMLPFSRLHEAEADEIGLVLMTMAGYNPEDAINFWERMSASSKGAPPEFLSTHPSHETRIKLIREKIPAVKAMAAKYK